MKSHICLSITAAFCASLLAGCASTTPVYHSAKASLTPQPGKGLVLIYFKPGFYESAMKWHIYANDQLLTDKFKRGAFFSHQAAPGELRLSTKQNATFVMVIPSAMIGQPHKDQATIRVEPKQTYYMEMAPGTWRENIKQVSKGEGEEGIKDCHWMNPATN